MLRCSGSRDPNLNNGFPFIDLYTISPKLRAYGVGVGPNNERKTKIDTKFPGEKETIINVSRGESLSGMH